MAAMVTTVKVFHLNGVILIDNDARVILWARASPWVLALDIARARERRVKTNVLVHMLFIQEVVFGVERLADFYGTVHLAVFRKIAVFAKLHQRVLVGTDEQHVTTNVAKLHGHDCVSISNLL